MTLDDVAATLARIEQRLDALTAQAGRPRGRVPVVRLRRGIRIGQEVCTIGEWCERYGVKRRTYEYRRAQGASVIAALTTPVGKFASETPRRSAH